MFVAGARSKLYLNIIINVGRYTRVCVCMASCLLSLSFCFGSAASHHLPVQLSFDIINNSFPHIAGALLVFLFGFNPEKNMRARWRRTLSPWCAFCCLRWPRSASKFSQCTLNYCLRHRMETSSHKCCFKMHDFHGICHCCSARAMRPCPKTLIASMCTVFVAH